MSRFRPVCLLWVSLVLTVAAALPSAARRPALYPDSVGAKVRCSATVELPRGYLSGICVLRNEGPAVRGCLFNEFGISALAFTYMPARQKVKIDYVAGKLNKWYIRRVLRRDLLQLMANLRRGVGTYRNARRHIDYRFTPLPDATEE